jgi:hypothetical protein
MVDRNKRKKTLKNGIVRKWRLLDLIAVLAEELISSLIVSSGDSKRIGCGFSIAMHAVA